MLKIEKNVVRSPQRCSHQKPSETSTIRCITRCEEDEQLEALDQGFRILVEKLEICSGCPHLVFRGTLSLAYVASVAEFFRWWLRGVDEEGIFDYQKMFIGESQVESGKVLISTPLFIQYTQSHKHILLL